MNLERSIDKRMRRAMFLAAHLTAIAALVGSVVLPICDVFADRDNRIAGQRALLVRLDAIAAQEANVKSMAQRMEAQVQHDEFLEGSSEGLVNANLQTRLKSLSESAGAKVRSAQSLPPRTMQQIKYSGSRIEIAGGIKSIQKAIYAIEGAKPYLFVTGAVMKSAPPTGRPGVPEEPVIQAQLDIFVPMQIEGRDP
jgi:general secretion pathway protein M